MGMTGDFPQLPWNDAVGYLITAPALPWYIMSDDKCTQCGAMIRDHIVGGPGQYHPVERASLWVWE